MNKQCVFSIKLLFSVSLMSSTLILLADSNREPSSKISDSERMTFDAITFSKNLPQLPQDFCNQVISTSPEDLKEKIKTLLTVKANEPVNRKIILHGPAGTGKTTLARVIAQELKGPFFFVKASALANEYKDSGSAGINRIAMMAQKSGFLVIIDEMDCISKEKKAGSGFDENTAKALGLLLDELGNNKITYIGTMNSLDNMPESLQSRIKGSLFKINAAPGNTTSKIAALNALLTGIKVDTPETINLVGKELAANTNRDIDNIVKLAYEVSLRRNRLNPVITYADFRYAINKLKSDEKEIPQKNRFDLQSIGSAAFQVVNAVDTSLRVLSWLNPGDTKKKIEVLVESVNKISKETGEISKQLAALQEMSRLANSGITNFLRRR